MMINKEVERNDDNINIKKKTFKEKIRDLSKSFIAIFKDYPITLIVIWILSLDLSILVECDKSELLETCCVFLGSLAVGSLFSEQIFKKKLSVGFFVSEAVALCLSVFYAWESRFEEVWLFGIDNNTACEQYLIISIMLYVSIAISVSLFSMFKTSKTTFDNFCLSAFTELFKTFVIYFVFAVGVAIIIGIFDLLIADSGYAIERVEVFLLGGVLTPLSLKAISNVKTESTKFARIMVLYVLMPLLIMAYAVIYIYIVKIIFSMELPSNEVFSIVAFLFCIGMPIWTMSHHFNSTVVGRIGFFIPFTFIPLMILQSVCIGIRVNEYGITSSRYMAIMLVVYEIIYLVLYIIKIIKKNNIVSYAFLAIPVLIFIGTLAPYTNVFDTVVRSQAARLDTILALGTDELSDADKKAAKSAYSSIEYSGYQGKQYIEEKYNKRLRDTIEEWNEYAYVSSYEDKGSYYYFDNSNPDCIEITGYNYVYTDMNFYAYRDTEYDIKEVELTNSSMAVTADFEEYVENAVASTESDGYNSYLDDNPYIIQNGYKIYVLSMNFRYGEETGVKELHMSCVVLE